MIGGKLAGLASNLFELELEGLSNEDKEFEVARAYVRFAGNAANMAARNPQWRNRPRQVASRATTLAARNYAPGLLKKAYPVSRSRRPQPGVPRYGAPAYAAPAYGAPAYGEPAYAAPAGGDGEPAATGGALSSGKWFIKNNRLYIRMDMVNNQENY
jgi:hypothetical protein